MKTTTMNKVSSETREVVEGIDSFEQNLMKQGIKPHIEPEDIDKQTHDEMNTKTFTRTEKKSEYSVG